MAYVKNTWVDREGTTRYHETVDEDGALIFTPDYEKVTEIGTPINADNMNHIEEGIEDHENRITVLEESGDASNFLNKSQITNCILEAPQNIKLELNDGVLTLKAGSKVIVPNGVGVFDEVVIANDIVLNNTTLGNREAYIIIRTNPLDIQIPPVLSCSSGTSTPSEGWYYNTTENKIYRDGLFEGASLPIAKVTYVNGSGVVSIDKTFNGMGYIGSTVWVDKGVKVLIPNGRNTDGTLNNREDVTPKVYTVTAPGTSNNYSLVLNKDGLYILSQFNTVSGSQPTTIGPCYTIETNKVYNNGAQRYWIHLANFSTNAGVFTNLDFKLPFRAVDYNEFNKLHVNNPYFFGQYIWSEFAPSNLSWLKSSGQWNSGIGYQSFYDWALANANANKVGFKLSTASYTDYDFVVNTSANTFRLPIKVKGASGKAVVGNGITIGLEAQSADLGLGVNGTNGTVGVHTALYGAQLPTSIQTIGSYNTRIEGVGLTTDPTKSGIELSDSGLSLYFYVGETVRDEFLIDVAQIASNFANKVEVVEAYSSGTSWYRVYSADQTGKRFCEQGYSEVTSNQTFTLLKSFTDTSYTAVATPNYNNATIVACDCTKVSNSEIKYHATYRRGDDQGTADEKGSVYVCGYIS